MKKRVLAILMAAVMSMSFIACGGSEDEGAANNDAVVENEQSNDDAADAEYTEEQVAAAEEYLQLLEDYQAAIDAANAVPELLEDQGFVDTMNELTDAVSEMDALFGDPSLLTDEVIAEMRIAFDAVYETIDEVNALVAASTGTGVSEDITVEDLAAVFTIGYVGADDKENTYYFICDEELLSAGLVVLSADETQNVMCIGDVTENEDGSITIVDEDGMTATINSVEEVEGGIILTIDEVLEVAMVPYDSAEVLSMMFIIEEGSRNVN